MENYFKILAITVTGLFGFGLIGYFLLGNKYFKINRIENFIVQIFVGLIFSVIVFALAYTNGKSVFISAIPLLYFLIYELRKTKNELGLYKKSYISLIPFVLFLITSVTLSYLIVHGNNDLHGIKPPILDQVYYISVAEGIDFSRVETANALLFPALSNLDIVPYHYFEMWLTIIAVKTFSVSHLMGMLGFALPLCLFFIMSFFYLASIKYLEINKNKFSLHITILLIIISVIFIFGGSFIPFINRETHFNQSLFFDGNQKFIYPFVFFIIGIYFFLIGSKKLFLTTLLFIPIVNVVFFPAIIGGLALFVIFNYFFIKDKLNVFFVFGIFTSVAIFLIYQKIAVSSGREFGLVLSLGGLLGNIKTNFIDWILPNLLFIVVILFFLWKKRDSNLIQLNLSFLFILCCAFIARAVLDNNQNAFQLLTGPTYFVTFAFVLIWVVLFLKYLSMTMKSIALVFTIVFIGLFISYSYSSIKHNFLKKIYGFDETYVHKISNQHIQNPIGIKIVDGSKRKTLQKNPRYAGLSAYFVLLDNIRNTVVLNIEELLPKNKSFFSDILANEFLESSLFTRETGYFPNESNISNIDSFITVYIEKLKPEFCIVEKDMPIPSSIQRLTNTVFVDSGTGEQFLILR